MIMLKFHDRLADMKRQVPLSSVNITGSTSHGYIERFNESVNFFIFSSTFYFDIKMPFRSLDESFSYAILHFYFARDLVGAVSVDLLDSMGGYIQEWLPIRRPALLSTYADTISLCLPLTGVSRPEGEAVFRIWLYADIFEPLFFTFKSLELVKHNGDVDLSIQLNDFIVPPDNHSWRDSLRPLIEAGWTDLHFITQWGHIELVKNLISEGVNPNIAENNGGTPLHRAIDVGNFEITKLLLESGANINPIDRSLLETPLDCAIRKDLTALSNLLSSSGARRYVDL